MKRKHFQLRSINIWSLCLILLLLGCSEQQDDTFSQKTKIALRDIGDQLLLSHQDSTTLVLPVKQMDKTTYELTFEASFSFEPYTLVSKIKNSLEKSGLPENYLVEVIHCESEEVAYSYEMNALEERTIIPCSGRFLPKDCYHIQLNFIDEESTYFDNWLLYYIIPLIGLLLLIFNYKRKKHPMETSDHKVSYTTLGSFKFYPEQNKLVKRAEEIKLSVKECELLAIFISKPNQVIKRDELMKKVWEDHGVIVGRSLDTYISKLRKKLKDDDSIKLTNIHGVGYKLELSSRK